MDFKERLEHEYPIPFIASIYGDPNLTDLDGFIKNCLDSLDSDLEIYESIEAHSMQTQLPLNTRAVTSVKLIMPFQGNRFVKHTFDTHTKICNLRYFPAIITFKRPVSVEDLSNLKGARLQYLLSYTLERMIAKEIAYLSAVKLESTEGAIDLNALEAVRERHQTLVKEYKEDIMIYSGS